MLGAAVYDVLLSTLEERCRKLRLRACTKTLTQVGGGEKSLPHWGIEPATLQRSGYDKSTELDPAHSCIPYLQTDVTCKTYSRQDAQDSRDKVLPCLHVGRWGLN